VSLSKIQIGIVGIVVLVVLRLAIGWHFFKEGAKKFTDPQFAAAPFLWQSKGPMSGLYQGMIADRWGVERLDYDRTTARWDRYLEQATKHYRFNEDQQKAAQEEVDQRKSQLAWYFDDLGNDLEKYLVRVAQYEKDVKESATRKVDFDRQRHAKEMAQLRGQGRPWIAAVDQLQRDLADDLYVVATGEPDSRWDGKSRFQAVDPGQMWLLNNAVRWTVILVGIFLLLGLCTRFWSLIGIGFLCSVITSQWPGAWGAEPTYYQAIELCGLLVLIVTNAGRFAGLDFFVDFAMKRCCRPKTQGNEQ